MELCVVKLLLWFFIKSIKKGVSQMVQPTGDHKIKLFSLNSNRDIAEKIAAAAGLPLGKLSSRQFSDGEIQINIGESVRGIDV